MKKAKASKAKPVADIAHEPEFVHSDPKQSARDLLAQAYRDAFNTAAGCTVLKDLRIKFGLSRRRFDPLNPNPSPLTAAMIEGECNVLRDIEAAIRHGA